jgi:uncharacterized protein (DUF1499 family)
MKGFLIAFTLLFLNSFTIGIKLQSSHISKFFSPLLVAVVLSSEVKPTFADDSLKPAPQIYGLKNNRLLPCKSKSNCISTSSIKSLDKYSTPWAFEIDSDAMYDDLINAIKADSYLKLVESDPESKYLHATAKSAVPPSGTDDVEFLVNDKDKIVTYRSNSRDVLFAGTQVIGDGGSNKNRLESIKKRIKTIDNENQAEIFAYEKEYGKLTIFEKMSMASQPNDINFLDNSVPDSVTE